MRTRPFALMACAVLAGCAAARAGLVVETWGGEGRFAHAKTLTVTEDGKRISIDLSALPEAAKVSSARLVCFRKPPAALPAGPVKVVQRGTVQADKWGLVTVRDLTVTVAKRRVRIVPR